MEDETAEQCAVEMVFLPGKLLVQYQPALDPVGRHWDEAMKRIAVLWPDLSAEKWDQLDEPTLIMGEDTFEETWWYLTDIDEAWNLVGRLRSLTVEEQAIAFLSKHDNKLSGFGIVVAALSIAKSMGWAV